MERKLTHDEVREVRMAAVRLLEQKGYKVMSASAGSGVPKFSRIKIEKGPEKLICVIKVTSGGRIFFTRETDGSYKVLSDADRVIHARPDLSDPAKVHVSMFDRSTVLEAFEANHEAKVAHKREHLPSWVNPEPEPEAGWRLIGSGFQQDALWSEVVSTTSGEPGEAAAVSPLFATAPTKPDPKLAFMENIKAMISDHMGVRPELIEIDVRIRV
jgi:hypothetical protein